MNNQDTNLQDFTNRELSDEEQLELLLEYLTNHKLEYIKDFLREKGLAHSYNKSRLRSRLKEYLEEEKITLLELVALLDKIEGWGKQQIYLYTAPSDLSRTWQNPEYMRREVKKAGFENLINKSVPLILPPESTLSTIEYSKDRIRFVWVERRTLEVRAKEYDRQEFLLDDNTEESFSTQLVMQAYKIEMKRGLIVFEWDLTTDDATLFIQHESSGKYKETRAKYEKYLADFFEINSFGKVRIRASLRAIEQSAETRRFQTTYESRDNRGKISLTSPNKKQDLFADKTLENVRLTLNDSSIGLLGNFYWLEHIKGTLPSVEIYTKLYGKFDDDQRIGILAEHTEEDIRYVLSRIRYYCP